MSDDHENVKRTVCLILEWYGFTCEDEYNVANGRIDCVSYRNRTNEPFMGIEVHLQGELDTDLKKLLSASYLDNKVIITPDRPLIDRMSKSMPEIFWCPPPKANDHTFENYFRTLSGAANRKEYWFQARQTVEIIQTGNGAVAKFEELLRENGLDVELAEEIIYLFAAANQVYFLDSEKYMETNEYKFLKSLGIAQGLGIYWFDMEWGEKARYTYEQAEVQDITATRKMKGEPLAYSENKEIINAVVNMYVKNILDELGGKINGYSKVFSEVALMGSAGYFRSHEGNFIPVNEFPSWTPPVEDARLRALVANPFLSQKVWEFGKELLKRNLGVKASDDLIMAPYKLISEVFRFSGSASEKEEEINEYLAWWILYNGGQSGKDIEQQSRMCGVPLEDVIKCIDKTFSMKLTSRYIKGTKTSTMSQFLESHGGHEIEGLSNITVFKPEEFKSYCSKKMLDSLNNIFGSF